ncbi:MAG TPA: hypothetical protein VLK26_11520, partial [Rudaea sp.]|nr:hypothetical protein [Rudaea sp.]
MNANKTWSGSLSDIITPLFSTNNLVVSQRLLTTWRQMLQADPPSPSRLARYSTPLLGARICPAKRIQSR